MFAAESGPGVGIVKLMGRDSGFVAMHAATAADVVDLCMIPEERRKYVMNPWKG